MHHIYLETLHLENYRNFKNLEIKVGNNPVIVIGENGSGKTNILEAISLFFPGRGIRSAKLDDICKRDTDYCSAHSLLQSKLGPAQITTHFNRGSSKRSTEFNGAKIQNNELSKFSSMIWLTPQMDGIFSAGISDRRKFFDRIVYNFNPSHAAIVHKYEYYMYERNKILAQDRIDENWLKVIEEKMAELSIEIASNRLKALIDIQEAINNLDNEFPKAILSIDGTVEQKISTNHAMVIDFIKAELFTTRTHDKLSGRTNFGVHKSDFLVIHKEKNALAKLCSTGEQKAMLIAIILAEVNYSIKEKIAKPILLLDEVFVHLDNRRKQYLIDFFIEVGLQLWITATDLTGIETLEQKAITIRLPV